MKASFKSTLLVVIASILILPVLLTGCFGNYGGMVSLKSYGMEITLDELMQNHMQYHIFYSGPETNPFAVLFDPKDEQKSIQTGKYWQQIKNQDILKKIISAMQMDSTHEVEFNVIKGKDNAFYGIMYTFGHTTIKHVEDNPNAVEAYPVTVQPVISVEPREKKFKKKALPK